MVSLCSLLFHYNLFVAHFTLKLLFTYGSLPSKNITRSPFCVKQSQSNQWSRHCSCIHHFSEQICHPNLGPNVLGEGCPTFGQLGAICSGLPPELLTTRVGQQQLTSCTATSLPCIQHLCPTPSHVHHAVSSHTSCSMGSLASSAECTTWQPAVVPPTTRSNGRNQKLADRGGAWRIQPLPPQDQWAAWQPGRNLQGCMLTLHGPPVR